jgi:hypothetical protein
MRPPSAVSKPLAIGVCLRNNSFGCAMSINIAECREFLRQRNQARQARLDQRFAQQTRKKTPLSLANISAD